MIQDYFLFLFRDFKCLSGPLLAYDLKSRKTLIKIFMPGFENINVQNWQESKTKAPVNIFWSHAAYPFI